MSEVEIVAPKKSMKFIFALIASLVLLAMLGAATYTLVQLREVKALTNHLNEISKFDEDRIDGLVETVANQEVLLQAQQKAYQDLSTMLMMDESRSQLFIQLREVNDLINSLSLIATKPMIGSVEPVAEEALSTNHWKARLQQIWAQFKAFIVIRRHVDEVAPLVASQGGDYIYQYVHLQLGMAQWAVLHNNHEVYQASLKQAKDWVERYFIANEPVTKDVLASLALLQTEKE